MVLPPEKTINVGSAADDGTGDPLRTAMVKINTNFTEVFDLVTGNEVFYPIANAGSPSVIVDHDLLESKLFYHTGIVSNFTVNLTNFSMGLNEVLNVVLILNQQASAYIPNAIRINNTNQTINWRGSAQPPGNPNKKDVVSFSILQPALGTYIVLATLTTFGTV